MSTKYIYNNSGSEKIYMGTPVADDSFFIIPVEKDVGYATHSPLIQDVADPSVDVTMSRDGSTSITNLNEALRFLMNVSDPSLRIKRHISKGGPSLMGRGTKFTATAGQTTTHVYEFTEDLNIQEGWLVVGIGATQGDTIDVELLTPSAVGDIVAHTFYDNWNVDTLYVNRIHNDAVTELNLNTYRFRTRYTNVGLTDITVGLNFKCYSVE